MVKFRRVVAYFAPMKPERGRGETDERRKGKRGKRRLKEEQKREREKKREREREKREGERAKEREEKDKQKEIKKERALFTLSGSLFCLTLYRASLTFSCESHSIECETRESTQSRKRPNGLVGNLCSTHI
jgi:hypothetical protein